MSGRDWLISKLKELDTVVSLEPISGDFIYIRTKEEYSTEEHTPFISAVIGLNHVARRDICELINKKQDFQFITNIPKKAVWTGGSISMAVKRNLGWGGVGDLMSAMGCENVEGFQRKEYAFVERGLKQHNRVKRLTRHFDRLIEVHRFDAPSVKTVLLNEYELTAEHIRHAREIYGKFSAILRTNPNGRATENAHSVASELGSKIFQWGQFLGYLKNNER